MKEYVKVTITCTKLAQMIIETLYIYWGGRCEVQP